jgi:serine protease Do
MPTLLSLRTLAASLVLLNAFLCPANAKADNLPQAIQLVKPAVVGIGTLMQMRSPPAIFRGTGFVVGDGLHVITNAHVVSQPLDLENKESYIVMMGEGNNVVARAAKRVAVDDQHDLALLQIGGTPLPTVSFGDSDTVKEGQSAAFTGYPIGTVLGLHAVTHRATVSALTPIVIPAPSSQKLDIATLKMLRTPYDVFQLDGTAYPGNSGSPLYDAESGRVIGIVNMVFVKETKESVLTKPSGISYAIPANFIRALMQRFGLH